MSDQSSNAHLSHRKSRVNPSPQHEPFRNAMVKRVRPVEVDSNIENLGIRLLYCEDIDRQVTLAVELAGSDGSCNELMPLILLCEDQL